MRSALQRETNAERDARLIELLEYARNEIREAIAKYPDHSVDAALANHKAGREVYDTNGDLW